MIIYLIIGIIAGCFIGLGLGFRLGRPDDEADKDRRDFKRGFY